MLAPGMTFDSNGRVLATVAPGIVPDIIVNGFGFMNDGSLAIDDAAPSGVNYTAGFRISDAGAVFGVDFLVDNFIIQYIQGIPLAADDRIIFNLIPPPEVYPNGNPIHEGSNAGLCII